MTAAVLEPTPLALALEENAFLRGLVGTLVAMVRQFAPSYTPPAHAPLPPAEDLPPIRAQATGSPLERRREWDRNYRRNKRKAEKDAKAGQMSLEGVAVGADATMRPPDASTACPPDASTRHPPDIHPTSRAVFSSFSVSSNGEEKKNNSLELDKEGGRPPDASTRQTPTRPPDAPGHRTQSVPGELEERLAATFAAHRNGARKALTARDKAALRTLLGPTRANGDEDELVRRYAIGLDRPANWRRVSNLVDLNEWWDDCAEAPPLPKAAETKARPAVDLPLPSGDRCAVCGETNCARVGAGEGTPLCYAKHLPRAAAADWRTPPDEVLAMARGDA